MAYSAMQIANAFIKKAQDGYSIPNLTPMKLQKLMFFAQSWYLKKYRTRLINDEFVRWRHGPVIQSVYYEFSSQGGNVLTQDVLAKDASGAVVEPNIAANDNAFLDAIIKTYGKYTGWQLSDMTHAEGGAWKLQPQGTIITNMEMFNGRV